MPPVKIQSLELLGEKSPCPQLKPLVPVGAAHLWTDL